MKTIKNNQAACVPSHPFLRSRSIPSTFPELCPLPRTPQGPPPALQSPRVGIGIEVRPL